MPFGCCACRRENHADESNDDDGGGSGGQEHPQPADETTFFEVAGGSGGGGSGGGSSMEKTGAVASAAPVPKLSTEIVAAMTNVNDRSFSGYAIVADGKEPSAAAPPPTHTLA